MVVEGVLVALSLGSLVLCKCFLIFLAHVSASFPRVPFLCTSPIPPPGSHPRRAGPLSFRIVLVLFLRCVLCATSALILLCRPIHVRVSPQAVSAACLAEDPDLADRLFSAWLDRASFSQVTLTMNRKSATFGNGWSFSWRRDLRFSVVLLLFLASDRTRVARYQALPLLPFPRRLAHAQAFRWEPPPVPAAPANRIRRAIVPHGPVTYCCCACSVSFHAKPAVPSAAAERPSDISVGGSRCVFRGGARGRGSLPRAVADWSVPGRRPAALPLRLPRGHAGVCFVQRCGLFCGVVVFWAIFAPLCYNTWLMGDTLLGVVLASSTCHGSPFVGFSRPSLLPRGTTPG